EESTASGSCGSGRGAGPKITVAPVEASNVDWWQGHRMWCVVCSYSATGHPTWVQIFEYATMPCTVQFSTVGGWSSPGANLMMIVAALVSATSLSWYPSGITVIIEPGVLNSD